MIKGLQQWLKRLAELLEIPAPEPLQVIRRIRIVELDIMLPLKGAGCLMLLPFMLKISSYPTQWSEISKALSISPEGLYSYLGLYILISIVLAGLLLGGQKLALSVVQWTAIANALLDSTFVAGLNLLTGGYDSPVFWLFVGLIVRNAISVPQRKWQFILTLVASGLSIAAAVISSDVVRVMPEEQRRTLGFTPLEEVGEPLFARLVVLWLTAACCYAFQVMFERQRQAAEEAREFATRESQLRSAGRLAAQIAHQIKNPLGIINNTAFSLKRAIKNAKPETAQQIEIIQEEVARADQIITQLMGYAQLTEGRVERLDITEELDFTIQEVFPPGVPSRIDVQRDFRGPFPPLLMQRLHVREVLLNLLQNAREALNGPGLLNVRAQCRSDLSIEVVIRDNGPGIPREKQAQVFEPYYTTKERGTGLGLAIVKQNMELYGGNVTVESELGKGACFTLLFPAKSLIRFSK